MCQLATFVCIRGYIPVSLRPCIKSTLCIGPAPEHNGCGEEKGQMEEEHRPVTHPKESPLKGVKPIASPEIGAAGLIPDIR